MGVTPWGPEARQTGIQLPPLAEVLHMPISDFEGYPASTSILLMGSLSDLIPAIRRRDEAGSWPEAQGRTQSRG